MDHWPVFVVNTQSNYKNNLTAFHPISLSCAKFIYKDLLICQPDSPNFCFDDFGFLYGVVCFLALSSVEPPKIQTDTDTNTGLKVLTNTNFYQY